MPGTLDELQLHSSGKVREIYEDGDELIMVASDRISAFDVVLPEPIPEKGKVVTQIRQIRLVPGEVGAIE